MDDERTAPEFDPGVKRVLAGIPAGAEEQESLGMVHYTPLPGSEVVGCMGCGMGVWLGPKQLKELGKWPEESVVLCPRCLLPLLGPGDRIVGLGPKGGEYRFKDGTELRNKPEA